MTRKHRLALGALAFLTLLSVSLVRSARADEFVEQHNSGDTLETISGTRDPIPVGIYAVPIAPAKDYPCGNRFRVVNRAPGEPECFGREFR